MGNFASGIAALPRIVTLHDVEIVPARGRHARRRAGDLTLNVTAKTYRYLEEDEQTTDGHGPEAGRRRLRRQWRRSRCT